MKDKFQVTALRPFTGVEGKVEPGQIIEVSLKRAEYLSKMGLGQVHPKKRKPEAEAAGNSGARPLSSPDGGRTIGAAESPSSSAPAQAPQPLTSDSFPAPKRRGRPPRSKSSP